MKFARTAAALIFAFAFFVLGGQAAAKEPVTLCHATGSASNPYVQITVDDDAVLKQGHDGHDGDIIPPFTGYAGKNWDASGQAIWNNGCNPVAPTTTTAATTPVPAPSSSVDVGTPPVSSSEAAPVSVPDQTPIVTEAPVVTLVPTASTLPKTGSSTGGFAVAGLVALALGGAALYAARRKPATIN